MHLHCVLRLYPLSLKIGNMCMELSQLNSSHLSFQNDVLVPKVKIVTGLYIWKP